MTTRRTKRGAVAAPLTHRDLATIERHARRGPIRDDISMQAEYTRQFERDVLRLAAELRRMGLVVQETML